MVSVEKVLTMFLGRIKYQKLETIIKENKSLVSVILESPKKQEIIGWVRLLKPILNYKSVSVDTILNNIKPYRSDIYNLLSKNRVWLENQIRTCKREIDKL